MLKNVRDRTNRVKRDLDVQVAILSAITSQRDGLVAENNKLKTQIESLARSIMRQELRIAELTCALSDREAQLSGVRLPDPTRIVTEMRFPDAG